MRQSNGCASARTSKSANSRACRSDIDEALIDALRAGLPDCAGVALGLDRVLMIDEGHDDLRKVTTFMPGLDDGL